MARSHTQYAGYISATHLQDTGSKVIQWETVSLPGSVSPSLFAVTLCLLVLLMSFPRMLFGGKRSSGFRAEFISITHDHLTFLNFKNPPVYFQS